MFIEQYHISTSPSKIFQANELNVMNSYESPQKKRKYLLNYSSFQLFSQRADYGSPTLWTAEQCEHSSGSPAQPRDAALPAPGLTWLRSCFPRARHPVLAAAAAVEIPASKRGWSLSSTSQDSEEMTWLCQILSDMASYRSSRSPGSPNNVCKGTRSLHQGSWPPSVAERALGKSQGSAFIW